MMRRPIFALCCASFLISTVAACRALPQAAEHLNDAANRQYAARDFARALETYRRAEVLRPDLPALNYNAANTLNQQNDFTRAIGEATRAIRSTDADLQDRGYYSMGNAYVRTNQLREAVDAYKSALRANPADADAKYNLEVIQRRLDQPESSPQQAQQGPSGAPGQPQPQAAQSDQGQPDQSQAGAQAQTGQGQSGQGQAGQAQAGQPSGSTANSSASGYTGTPEGQAAALDPDLKQALEQFNQTGNVDDALRALDIAQHQERLQQAAGNGDVPQPQGRDW
jgi:tetratricopeptide (TPR) repeat protein